MYPYWCGKGYARFTESVTIRRNGPVEAAAGFASHLDIVVSMIIYTVATVAFYLLAPAFTWNGSGARRQGYDSGVVEYLHSNPGRLVTVALLPGHRHALRDHLCGDRSKFAVGADMLRLMGVFAADDYEQGGGTGIF